jgi:Cupin domain
MLVFMRTMIQRSALRGQMAPLHVRDEDESYRVLRGEVTFFVGHKQITARPGDVVDAPRGVGRTLRAESDSGWLVTTSVSSLERFAEFGRAVCAPLADPYSGWPSPDEESSLAAIAATNGIELIAPPGALPAEALSAQPLAA